MLVTRSARKWDVRQGPPVCFRELGGRSGLLYANTNEGSLPVVFAGDMHDRLKEYEAALQDYDLALRILGKNAYEVRWNIFLMRAKDLVELHRFEEAVPALQSALEYPGYKEGDTTAYELLAKAYKEQKQYSQARWAVMASLSVDPSNIQ